MRSAAEFHRAPAPSKPIRVLLLEDMAVTVEVVKAYLEAVSNSAHVETAGTLGAALEFLAHGTFDLVIADLNLPDSRGLETLDRLVKATECLIVVLTVEEDPRLYEAAIALGAYDFLQKKNLNRVILGRIVRLATIQANTFRILRDSEARFRSLTELSSDFYWETDAFHRIVETTHGSRHRAVNARGAQIGKTRWEIPSVHPDAAGWQAHRATLDARLPFHDFEIARLDAEGGARHLSISGEPVFNEAGEFLGFRGVGRDITTRKQAEARIQHLATRDVLTGLPNRGLLSDRFEQMIAQARRHRRLLGVLFIDLDRFKLVNDSHGHSAGDALLKEVAHRLQLSVRAGDTVGRISGDEFAIILGDLERADDASLVAQKIIESVRAPVQLAEKEMFVTASVGIALFPDDGNGVEALFGAADAAMYQAKQAGGNTRQFFTAEIEQRTRARAKLGTELRLAIERQEFTLAYQPKYDLVNGGPCGAEALLRWNHPARGAVSPAEFIPVLEDFGLILAAGEWVLGRVCEDLNEWRAAGLSPLPVAVNLSARQLQQADLNGRIASLLELAHVEPGLIELEITESQLMGNPEQAIRIVRGLSDIGIRIALDDFGTGYSSLAYLNRLPLHSLKIDRSFIHEMTEKRGSASIVATIVALAKSLRLRVVAEGVETDEQAKLVRLLGCDEAQGYFFARPMPAAAFRELLAGRPG